MLFIYVFDILLSFSNVNCECEYSHQNSFSKLRWQSWVLARDACCDWSSGASVLNGLWHTRRVDLRGGRPWWGQPRGSLKARTGLGLLSMCWELGSRGVAWNRWDISRARWLFIWDMWDAVLVRVVLSEYCWQELVQFPIWYDILTAELFLCLFLDAKFRVFMGGKCLRT